jgi:hypothetical protein
MSVAKKKMFCNIVTRAMPTSPALRLAAGAMTTAATGRSATICPVPTRGRSANPSVFAAPVLRVPPVQPPTIAKPVPVTTLFKAMAIQRVMSVRPNEIIVYA